MDDGRAQERKGNFLCIRFCGLFTFGLNLHGRLDSPASLHTVRLGMKTRRRAGGRANVWVSEREDLGRCQVAQNRNAIPASIYICVHTVHLYGGFVRFFFWSGNGEESSSKSSASAEQHSNACI